MKAIITCKFHFRWCYDGLLSIGYEADSAFLMYKDNNPFIINFLGLGTANGSTGQWTVEGKIQYINIVKIIISTKMWQKCSALSKV